MPTASCTVDCITLRQALITFREFVYHEVINRLGSLASAGMVSFFFLLHVPRPLATAGHETSMHTQLAKSAFKSLTPLTGMIFTKNLVMSLTLN